MKISKWLTGLLATLASASVFAVPVTLELVFDNFPNETAFGMWETASAPTGAGYVADPGLSFDGIAYDVGASSPIGFGDGYVLPGDFGGEPPGVPFTFVWDLGAGDYTFFIMDTFGDGICCGFGAGSYELSSGGDTIFAGGEFGDFDPEDGRFTIEEDDNGTSIPEPGILTLLGLGLIGMFGARRRRI